VKLWRRQEALQAARSSGGGRKLWRQSELVKRFEARGVREVTVRSRGKCTAIFCAMAVLDRLSRSMLPAQPSSE
jgi:hypothetical protein